MTAYLLGDSHLAQVRDGLERIAPDVANLAVGGAVVDDLPGQLAEVPAGTATLVLSIGTNDADPPRGRPLADFRHHLTAVVGSRPARWVYVASPGCVGTAITPGWTADRIAAYAGAAAAVVALAGGEVLDTPAVLAPAGPAAFEPDGFHLGPAGYALLLPALAHLLWEGSA